MNEKIKYSVGLNGRPGNLESILEEDVYEVYASAPPHVCATARRGNIHLSPKEMKRQIELAHAYDTKYNVLLNGSCQGGVDFSSSFQDRIARYVKEIDDMGADGVTVANPFILDIVRKSSKRLTITVSNSSGVVDVAKTKRYEARGADVIVLHWNVHRDFEMVKKIRAATRLPIKVIPNQGCLNFCEWFISHVNIVSHISTPSEEEIGAYGEYDFPLKRCRSVRQTDPIEFLMSSFIRPEDVHIFLDMGLDIVKFSGRRSSNEWILNVIRAYKNRSYDGNLFDLSSQIGERPKIAYLPNKALDGWYEYMGSKREYATFRKKAEEFCQMKKLDQYLSKKNTKIIDEGKQRWEC